MLAPSAKNRVWLWAYRARGGCPGRRRIGAGATAADLEVLIDAAERRELEVTGA